MSWRSTPSCAPPTTSPTTLRSAPTTRSRRLRGFAAALTGSAAEAAALPKAVALRASLQATGVSPRHALDLLAAFTQDATRLRYRDWPDLLGYCALSARPVGRYLLDLHGEPAALYALSDPLCDALQVLNHLQDCQDDYRRLDRVYLPLDRFAAAGIGVEELDRPHAEPGAAPRARRHAGRRRSAAARRRRSAARARRAAGSAPKSAVILAIAQRLAGAAAAARSAGRAGRARPRRAAALRPAGPRPAAAAAPRPCSRAAGEHAIDRDHGAGARPRCRRAPTSRRWSTTSGSSFYWSMRLLPRPKRDAMYAIYAFCREVDDVADGEAPPAAKLALLDGWRAEIEALFAGRPGSPTTLALAQPVARYELPQAEFDAMIDGMEMDAAERMQAPARRPSSSAIAAASRARSGCSRSACSARAGRSPSKARSRSARRCSSPTSCATSPRMPAAGGSTCRASCSSATASRPPIPAARCIIRRCPQVCDALAARARERFAAGGAPVRRRRPAAAAAGAGDDAGLPPHARAADRPRLAAARPAGADCPSPSASGSRSATACSEPDGGRARGRRGPRRARRGDPAERAAAAGGAVRGRPAGRRPLPLLLRSQRSTG